MMAVLALTLFVLYVALAFGARTVLQLRRTGSTGFKGFRGRPGSAEWLGGVLFVVGLVLGLVAPVLDLSGVIEPISVLDSWVVHALGLVIYGLGLTGTLLSQGAMGGSWRIGVDESERTELVTTGAFALVRNPIFSGMIPSFLGLALLVPNVVALTGFLTLAVAVELQTRFVEEPYLLKTHGECYAGYASRVGRFVPGFGRLKP